MNRTKIEWADFSWNVITGCTKRCDYCYANRLARGRLRKLYLSNPNVAPGCNPDDAFSPRFWPDRLDEPFRVKKPSKIFVCSMGELFDPSVPCSWTEEVLATAGEADWHTPQFLTKQPHIAAHYTFPENAWVGVTVEDEGVMPQARLARLAEVKAPVRFVSFEPLMGPAIRIPSWVNWVIIGAMTGPGATKPEPEWVQTLIDTADAAGIPVFLKDNLDWPEPRQQWPRGE